MLIFQPVLAMATPAASNSSGEIIKQSRTLIIGYRILSWIRNAIISPFPTLQHRPLLRSKGRCCSVGKGEIIALRIQERIRYPIINVLDCFIISPEEFDAAGVAIASTGWKINISVVELHEAVILFVICFYPQGPVVV